MPRPTNSNLVTAQYYLQKALQETQDPFQRDLAFGLRYFVHGVQETVAQIFQEIDSLKQPVKTGMAVPPRFGSK
jgi:uncharacterized lipoprotein YddW (UPF0748 family)